MKNQKHEAGLKLSILECNSDLRPTRPALNPKILALQNQAYLGTGGASQENRNLGFVPAYMDTENGRVEMSRYADGRTAPIHLLEGLPEEWILKRSTDNQVLKVKESVVDGFIRNGHFYTRLEAAKTCSH